MFNKMICLMIIFIEGHTTMLCPHRVATEFGVSPAPFKSSHSSLEYVFERQLKCRVPAVMLLVCSSIVRIGLSSVLFSNDAFCCC